MAFSVRQATVDDTVHIVGLIKELAENENLSEQVTQTEEGLIRDGFTEGPYYKCLVAEVPADQAFRGHTVVGFALYFPAYGTWKGRAIYLEGLYVMKELQDRGIGAALLQRVTEIALQNKCSLLNFVVLNNNFPSIDFYQAKGAVDLTKSEGKGIGSALLRKVAEVALQNKCSLLNFVVLNNNFPSIDFYQAKGAVDLTKSEGWHLFRFQQEQLEKLAGGKGQNAPASPSP